MNVLAVGDMHLGRRPSRLPEPLQGQVRQLGPAGTWNRLVESALDYGVDAVLLAGDVVESSRDFFEAHRLLQQGIQRLEQAGVAVIAVAGNHDVHVLPRLAHEISGFRLLGQQGQWESTSLSASGEQLTVWGWSFPRPSFPTSPLAGVTFERSEGVQLGLLHGDRDQPGSPYAPFSSGELNASNLDGWLLGHIHKPDLLSASNPSGYLGSIAGLDPGEPGPHGPWLLRIEAGAIRHIEHWPLARLRWESLEVDVTGITDCLDLRPRILEAVRQLDQQLVAEPWPPQAVGLRLTISGQSPPGLLSPDLLSVEDRECIHQGTDSTHYFVEKVMLAIRPPVALEELAQRRDPVGLLARRMVLLDAPPENPERQQLLQQTRQQLAASAQDARWSALAPSEPDDVGTAHWLRQSGLALLEQMLAQQEQAP
ncbi:metallophosphoesterase family protein [Desulfurispira natronophila]|uniref:DNA repair exonuclease SbcCD nuclease subunit n=1 Tax=Desulfurispira natronophila TaxID=682562 RepID=A0A7W7Y4I1_9BACT|nr:DNA repair exonuclease [Desulfurispira natronophila]MBB5021941.1 DNA repair exonuclease SbcCD nuclease subunit [Desulfurispira natronophila]